MKYAAATEALHAALDVLEVGLEGMPLAIERPDKEDFVLVSAETYSNLLKKIYDLEEELKTDEQREAEEQEVLNLLVGRGSGRLI